MTGCSVLAVFSTSRPVLPPIFRSLTTTSKKPSCSFSMAALPFGASSTSWPGFGQRLRESAAERVVIVGDQNASHASDPRSGRCVFAQAAGGMYVGALSGYHDSPAAVQSSLRSPAA